MSENQRYQRLLSQQQAMNKETWNTLLGNGFNPDSEIQLDFFYYGPNKEKAGSLLGFLKKETDYVCEVVEKDGRQALSGKTQPTKISPEILDQWVD